MQMTKKFILSLTALAMLAGCSPKVQEIPEEVEEEEVIEEDTSGKIWIVEPNIQLEKVRTMTPFEKTEVLYESPNYGLQHVLGDFERIGYPQEWTGKNYDTNAVIVEKNGQNGIWNYNGEEVSPADVNIHSTPYAVGIGPARLEEDGSYSIVYGYASSTGQTGIYYSEDYKEKLEVSVGNFAYAPYQDERRQAYFAIQDGVFGVAVPIYTEEEPVYGFKFEAWPGDELPGNSVVPIVDAMCKPTSYVLCDSFGNIMMDAVEARGTYVEGTFANGHYVVGTSEDVAYVDAYSGTQISWSYHGYGYFSDGYAPVKKYGRWGYIDLEGNEVTDCIFTDATELYNGRCYVRYGDTYGILNLKEALEAGKELNVYTLYATNKDEKASGSVAVNVSDLNLRTGPGTGYDADGNALEGTVYPVFESAEAEGYTWYRIDQEHWIPTEGSWLTYSDDLPSYMN